MFPSVTAELQLKQNDIGIPFSRCRVNEPEYTRAGNTLALAQSKIAWRRALAPPFFCSYFVIQKIELKGVSGCAWVSVGRRAGACVVSVAEIGFIWIPEFRFFSFFDVVLSGCVVDTDVLWNCVLWFFFLEILVYFGYVLIFFYYHHKLRHVLNFFRRFVYN